MATESPQSSDPGSKNLHPDHLAWNAVRNGERSTTVHSATVSSPKITRQLPNQIVQKLKSQPSGGGSDSTPPLDLSAPHPPTDGFILSGSIELFGVPGLKANFYSHHGPIHAPTDIQAGTIPIYQIAYLEEDLRISSILPNFAGTKFDILNFKQVSFTYQNSVLDRTKRVGLTIESNIVFDKSYGQIHDVLSQFLGIANPTLDLRCNLGIQDWHQALSVPSFALEGVFYGIQAKLVPGVTLTSIGVQLIGFHCVSYSSTVSSDKEFGYELFGSMHLQVPGSSIPLDLNYKISEMGETLYLSAELTADWTDALGIKSLTLREVNLGVELDIKDPKSNWSFDISAVLEAGETIAQLSGVFSTGGDFTLTAEFDQLGLTGINDLFNHLFKEELTAPETDIHIGQSILTISKTNGFSVQAFDFQIGEHRSSEVMIKFNSKGVDLDAKLSDGVMKVGEFQLSNARVQVSFGRFAKQAKTNVLFGGVLEWQNFVFNVGVHVYESDKDGKGTLEYTLYGQFARTSSGTPMTALTLATLVPSLDNFLKDIALTDAALIITSKDDPEFGALNHSGYPTKSGIQVCASLEIKTFNQISRGQHPGALMLNAGWSKEGFSLDIVLYADTVLHLGRGVVTDPIKLKIMSKPPALTVSTGALIPVEKSKTPLHFSLDMTLNEIGATATGELKGGWNNPLGISEKLTIGPVLALQLSIKYATFFEQGPSGLGFVGDVAFGDVSGRLAFEVNDNPSNEMLSTNVKKLDIKNLVDFVDVITNLDLPHPPNVLSFDVLDVYICSGGVKIGDVDFPPGFSFKSQLTLFGMHADAQVIVGDGGVHCSGGLDAFSLANGLIKISGVNTPRASYDLKLTKSEQGGTVDGMIELFGIHTKVLGTVGIHPKLIVDFQFDLSFGGFFDFEVHAGPVTSPTPDSSDVKGSDYKLDAKFHSAIRDHISKRISDMFKDLEKKEREKEEAAKADLELKKEAWRNDMAEKKKSLDASEAAWTKKSNESHTKFNETMNGYKANLDELQGKLSAASTKFKADIAQKKTELSAANAARGAKIRDKENELRHTRTECDNKLQDAHHKLDEATQKLHSGFGNVDQDIKNAQQKVDSLQNTINDVNNHISSCENAHWWDLVSKAQLPGLFAERWGLGAAKDIAYGVLTAARGILAGAEFATCKGALGVAQEFLDKVQAASDAALKLANKALQDLDKATNLIIQDAQKALDEVGNLGQSAINEASGALDKFKTASSELLKDAQAAIDILSSCEQRVKYEAAKDALAVVNAAGSALFNVAEVGVTVAGDVEHAGLEVARWMVSNLTSLISISDVSLYAEVGKGVGGFAFSATVQGTVGGNKSFNLSVSFNLGQVEQFLKELFNKLVEWIKKNLL